MLKQLLRSIALVAIVLLGGGQAMAQVTTSAISGHITDAATKEALIGANIVIKHLPTGTQSGAMANAKGNYTVMGLRPGGPYLIEVSYIGYRTETLKSVSLDLGETTYLNFALREDAGQLEQVVVTADKGASFNANRTGAGSSFNRTAIDRTASVNRSLFDIAKLTPQAGISSNGAISFAGSNNRYNSFQIDGSVSNDVFGLSSSGTNGGQTGSTPISLEAIDALQVVLAPYDVRQSGFTGGGINAVTKSGTNEFKGSLYGYYRNQDFFGYNDAKGMKKFDKQYRYATGATLGGAIIKDKLFFFVNGEVEDETYPSRYIPGDGNQTVKLADAQAIEAKITQLTGGYNSGGFASMDVPRRSYKGLARLDWNINQAHRLTLRYSYLQATKMQFSNAANILRFQSYAYDQENKTHSFVAELNSKFSNSVSNELRASYNRIRDKRTSQGAMPSISISVGRATVYLGNDAYSPANELDQDIFSLTDNLTWQRGNHTYTFGLNADLFQVRNLFIPNFYGSYSFATLDDFLNVDNPTNPTYPSSYQYQAAIESVTGTKRYAPSFGAAQVGFYAQDEWRVNDQLRLTYGLRVDVPIFFDTPRENQRFNASALATSNGVQNNIMPSSTPLFSPRVGFRYHIDETRKHLIRGGVGIFTGRIPFVWLSNSFANTGIEFGSINFGNARAVANAVASQGFAFNLDPNRQFPYPNGVAAAGTTQVDMVKSNFKMPQTLRANLAFETVLPADVRLTLEGMFTKTMNNIYYRNINQIYSGSEFNHGSITRPLYAKADNNYTYALVLDNTSRGYSYNFTAQLAKDFDFGLSASLAYTFGESFAPIDGTSSIGSSNWKYSYTFAGDRNQDLDYTTFDIRHRLVGTLGYTQKWGKSMATTIGLTYNGQTGPRFSLAYNGDINGDGERGNDLMYIPTAAEVQAMPFADRVVNRVVVATPAQQATQLEAFINEYPELRNNRGNYLRRNALVSPFIHQFDLHFSHDFYFNVAGRKHTLKLIADVENIGNLINKNWGQQYSAGYSQSPLAYNSQTGKYIFSAYEQGTKMWRLSDFDSRWKAQIGIKYIF